MATWEYVPFFHHEAQRLADMHGVSYDLELVCSFCSRFLENDYLDSRENMLLSQALFTSAVVPYGRAFGSGVRSGVTQGQLGELSDELQASHRYFKDVRDKFVAHSVNVYEDNQVNLYLMPEGRGDPGVASIGLMHSRVATLSGEDIERLQELALTVQSLVKAEITSEQERVLQFAKSLPLAEVRNFPKPSAIVHPRRPDQVRRPLRDR